MKKAKSFIERHGFILLLLVCVGIIAGSGLWAYAMRAVEPERAVDGANPQHSMEEMERLRMAAPLSGDTLTPFGDVAWLPTLARFGSHEGLDIRGEKGQAVHAARDGKVDAVYRDGSLGAVVELSHGEGLTSRYAALAWPLSVQEGDSVLSGQTLGKLGSAPMEVADGPHLHFEVWLNGRAVNPALYIME